MADSAPKAASLIANEIEQLLKAGRVGVLVTIIDGSNDVGAKLLVDDTGRVTAGFEPDELQRAVVHYSSTFLTSRDENRSFQVSEIAPELSGHGGVRLLFERIQVEPRVIICGAGHVGAALAKLAAFTGFQVTLIDDRGQFLNRELFDDQRINLVTAEVWADAVRRAIGNGAGVSIAIVTRGHNEDEQCLRAVMDARVDYVGMIGSKRRTNIVLQRLRDAGVEEEKVLAVRAPIGVDIGAVTPEEVAVAILAEIIAERRGGKSGSMSAWRRS